ncbi:unnamed protein product [Clonostachys rosea f. rosea IK726]|uniref:Uncharacterized protein n=1 Tax=Clonostachys rosea f. rosea IK726 TaxID=1349383 RepID=A0ACA9ULT1_BIOOC|nr:unnamed protein product [Clonostachys rosea f. rosea IK726]
MAVNANNSVPDHQVRGKWFGRSNVRFRQLRDRKSSVTHDEESLLTNPVMAFVVARAFFVSSSNPHQEMVREDRQIKLKFT